MATTDRRQDKNTHRARASANLFGALSKSLPYRDKVSALPVFVLVLLFTHEGLGITYPADGLAGHAIRRKAQALSRQSHSYPETSMQNLPL